MPPKFNKFLSFATSHFDWLIQKKMKKLQLCKFPKIEVSIKDGGPNYTCETRTILVETYGIKVWCY